jgi:glycosyltransferase involved in cell wall biosynthesis
VRPNDLATPPGRLRLLYVINGLGPGGAERSLAELLPLYLASDIDPILVCLRRKARGVEAAVRDLGCEIRFLPARGLGRRVRALRQLIVAERAHLVHTTLFDADLIGRLAAVGTGVPVLTSLVNTSYDRVRLRDPNIRRTRLWVTHLLDRWTARHLTSHFHAITEAVKESAIGSLGIAADRVTVVERGRTRERLGAGGPQRRREARCRLEIAEDAEVVVNVARQEYQKGQVHLLRAAAILARTRPKVVVVIAGREGHASRELIALRDHLGLEEKVRFLGHRDDVPEVLAAADLFAFPSVYEGLGGALIEAMALGLPIVASDIPALREVIEDGQNGILVAPESAEALAGALGQLLDDPYLAASFGARSVEIFSARFTIGRSAERMIALYRRVAGVSADAPGRPAAIQPGGALV